MNFTHGNSFNKFSDEILLRFQFSLLSVWFDISQQSAHV